MDHIVFVYGTLRRGEGNAYLLKDSKWLGPAVTAGYGYQMTRSGTIPFTSDGGDCAVLGELWVVDDATFKRLDRLEGHPRLYRRRRRRFWLIKPNRRLRGWIYLCLERVATPVQPGALMWLRCPTRLELQASGQL